MKTAPVTAIIQARLGSTRLPGKVLLKLGDRSVLAHVVSRVRAARLVDAVVVATTSLAEDDAVVAEAERLGVGHFRGAREDVLSRYLGAAAANGAHVVMRVTADCPLLDPAVADAVVRRFAADDRCDYASNTIERSFPRGLDVEVFSLAALEAAAREATEPDEREHVTLFFHRRPARFRLCSVRNDRDLSHHRWTLDTPEDYRFLTALLDAHAERGSATAGFLELAATAESRPDILAINAGVRQRAVGVSRMTR